MASTYSEPIHLRRALSPAGVPALDLAPVASLHAGRTTQTVVSGAGRAGGLLANGISLLALVWGLPFAVLLVGTPVALTIVFLLWLARSATSLF